MTPKRILNYLEKNGIKYKIVEHRPVYTALDKSATLHLPPSQVVKTALIKISNQFFLVLVPAHRNIDFKKIENFLTKELKKHPLKNTRKKKISFVSERWMRGHLKGIKLGNIPPFGSFWKYFVLLDKSLLREKKLIVNGGDYRFSLELSQNDFRKSLGDYFNGIFSQAKSKKTRKKSVKKK